LKATDPAAVVIGEVSAHSIQPKWGALRPGRFSLEQLEATTSHGAALKQVIERSKNG
jgi:hypothetical protein